MTRRGETLQKQRGGIPEQLLIPHHDEVINSLGPYLLVQLYTFRTLAPDAAAAAAAAIIMISPTTQPKPSSPEESWMHPQ